MPKVSVILPAYNCAKYLSDSLSSVLSQTFGDLEVVLVDDGSTDATEALVAERFRDPRIRYIKQEHLGLSYSRNHGIDKAMGELVAFIDADDIFLNNKIERQVLAFERHMGTEVVYTSEKYFYGGNKDALVESPHEKLSGDLLFFLKRSNFIHISTVMARRSTVKDIRFDPALKSHEDWDFFLKLSAQGRRFFCLPEALSLIRIRQKSMTAESSVMDSSRAIVGERAKELWNDLKRGIGMASHEGISSLSRYLWLKARAGLLNFPNAPRFNRPTLFNK